MKTIKNVTLLKAIITNAEFLVCGCITGHHRDSIQPGNLRKAHTYVYKQKGKDATQLLLTSPVHVGYKVMSTCNNKFILDYVRYTIKALLRDSKDSKRVMLMLALHEIRYVQ